MELEETYDGDSNVNDTRKAYNGCIVLNLTEHTLSQSPAYIMASTLTIDPECAHEFKVSRTLQCRTANDNAKEVNFCIPGIYLDNFCIPCIYNIIIEFLIIL